MTPETDPFPPAPRAHSVPPGLHAGLRIAGKYELSRKLGTGAMGEVWAAKHLSLDEEVAIKLVMRDVAHDDGTTAESRFLFEARVAAALSRKTRHIVNVTDHGEDGPLAYLVMELLEGESLDARLARTGPLPLAKVAPLVVQIARGLSVAHGEGIVHRDLKPSNVFVTTDEDGRALVKILDFGIAKMRASVRRVPTARIATGAAPGHATMHGFLLGTPAYMSPEQAKGRTNVDHRADVWALGVIAYHLLTGEYPFEGETFEELLQRLCRPRPIPIRARRPDLPEVVSDFFARAFAPSIDERFQSASAFAGAFEQLEPLAKGASPSLPPPRPQVVSAPSVDDGTLLAAGVPARGSIWTRLAAGALVLAVLAGTTALVSLHLEREPIGGARLTAGAVVREAALGPPTSAGARDAIPAPADVDRAVPVTAHDLPAAKPPVVHRPAAAAPSPPSAEQTAVEPEPEAPVKAARFDKSEVF